MSSARNWMIRISSLLVVLLVGHCAIADDGTPTQITVQVVAADLTVRPVPKTTFTITSPESDSDATRITTSFQGTASLILEPGEYVIRSDSSLPFEGNLYAWEVRFQVKEGETTVVELSNDNAQIQEATATEKPATGESVVLNEGEIFRRYKDSVFKVISESGHGSGFLVHPQGLILTNHHVVSQSDYLAVKVDAKHKYAARLIAEDASNDIAVIRVHPDVVDGLKTLALAEDGPEEPPVSVGERVIAVGSPLTAETIITSGIVSKVEEGAIISDVNINPGNSGGPLFSGTGEVVGINTFGFLDSRGPGVSGIVRIYLAEPVVRTAVKELSVEEPPSARRLPMASTYRFPPEELREVALQSEYNHREYHVEAGKFDVQLITPVVLAQLEVDDERKAAEFREKRSRRKKQSVKEYKPGESFYEWRRYLGHYEPVVIVQAVPEITMTGGSTFAVIMLGPNVRKRYKFKADFDRMELLRDGTVVEPIHPGRAAQIRSMDTGLNVMEDMAYYGAYRYPPEAFEPGATVILKVWQQGKPNPKVRALDEDVLERIWSDFEPYFAALQEDVAGT